MRIDLSGCTCPVADRLFDTGHVRDWYVQIQSCRDCGELIEVHINHQAEIDGAADPDNRTVGASLVASKSAGGSDE